MWLWDPIIFGGLLLLLLLHWMQLTLQPLLCCHVLLAA